MVEKSQKPVTYKPGFPGLYVILWILLPILSLTSCKKEEAGISLSKTSIYVDSNGGEATVRVKSDQKWTISSIDQDWIEADPLKEPP